MAVLKAKQRKALPDSDFAIPSERKFPLNDRKHAANAKARVSQFGTEAEKATVAAAVAKKYPDMGKGKKSK